jgi:transcriptional regulator with XRE-family HTH domain
MTLASQLHQARLRSGLTLADLCRRAALTCTADSLCRKLAGKQILTTSEAEALAQALDLELTWTPARRARRRAA